MLNNDQKSTIRIEAGLLLILLLSNVQAEPNIVRISPDELHIMAMPSLRVLYPDKTVDQLNNIKLYGQYAPVYKTIYLSTEIDLNSLEGQAIFHHEYKHYLDDINHVNFECLNEAERSAYEFENEFRWANDMDLIPYSYINKVSLCP